jgi:23S rRNA (cytidine1920-2'-O)/16S rRNA (cytidine1409-2'-O)-methyltransferase
MIAAPGRNAMKPSKPLRERLDQLLVARGLADSREKAKALILAGEVLVNQQKASKPGELVAQESALEVKTKLPYVSRGGLKLERALDEFQIAVQGKICLDVGSSTGGFTDCLLQRGAARVYAIDSGTNQLDWKLRSDPRVIVKENTNARYLTAADLGEAVDLLTMDVSFISVTLILPAVAQILKPDGQMVILIKPQFEVGRGQVGKGGIVREPELQHAACEKVRTFVEELGFRTALIESPILGAEGNREFLLNASH